LQEERFIFGSWFQKFQTMVSSYIAFRSLARKKLHGGRAWESKAAHFMVARKQRQKEPGTNSLF
jgi:hypothetical protein